MPPTKTGKPVTVLFKEYTTKPLNLFSLIEKITDEEINLLTELDYLNRELMYNNNQCLFCKAHLSSRARLRDHYKKYHTDKQVECSKCSEKFFNNAFLYYHIINDHLLYPTEGKKLTGVCFICKTNKPITSKDRITRHYKEQHFAKKKLICDECVKTKGHSATFMNESNLKEHMKLHEETQKILYCPFIKKGQKCQKYEGSPYSKTYDLHMLKVHMVINPKRTLYKCDDCSFMHYDSNKYDVHYKRMHTDELVYFCKDKKCKADKKGFRSMEQFIQHNIEYHNFVRKLFYCEHSDCAELDGFTTKQSLQRHMKSEHPTGYETWKYNCELKLDNGDTCTYHTDRKQHINIHLQYTHDVGGNFCDFCLEEHYSSYPYTDVKGKHNICKKCYHKITGFGSRHEDIMSTYLDTKPIKKYLVGSNDALKMIKALKHTCTSSTYRPDKMYIVGDMAIIVECDERSHSGSVSYQCDEKRISDISSELKDYKLVVLRWNPDSYKPHTGYTKYSSAKRLEILCDMIEKVIRNPPMQFISIHYMFYNRESQLIARHYPISFIDDVKDFDNCYKASIGFKPIMDVDKPKKVKLRIKKK